MFAFTLVLSTPVVAVVVLTLVVFTLVVFTLVIAAILVVPVVLCSIATLIGGAFLVCAPAARLNGDTRTIAAVEIVSIWLRIVARGLTCPWARRLNHSLLPV